MSKRTFHYWTVETPLLSAIDLKEEGTATAAQAFKIEISENGLPFSERAEALYLPDEKRLGIAWGTDATWADVDDVKSGIDMWLNDGEAWAARN